MVNPHMKEDTILGFALGCPYARKDHVSGEVW